MMMKIVNGTNEAVGIAFLYGPIEHRTFHIKKQDVREIKIKNELPDVIRIEMTYE